MGSPETKTPAQMRAKNPNWGRPFDVDEGRYNSKYEPWEPLHGQEPREQFSQWEVTGWFFQVIIGPVLLVGCVLFAIWGLFVK